MAAITALTENFTGGAVGATVTTGNTIFDAVQGTGTSTFITDPFLGGANRMMEVNTSASDKYHQMDFAAQTKVWFNFDFDIETVPTSTTTILQGMLNSSSSASSGKLLDLRIVANTRTIQLRNVNSAVWTSSALSDNTKYRIFVMATTSPTRRIRVVIYNADGTTQLQDSGEITSTATEATIGNIRIGSLTNSTMTVRFGRLRGDDSVGPTEAPPETVTGEIAELTEDFAGAAPSTAISTSNTIFDAVQGTGTSVFSVDPLNASQQVMTVTTSASDKYHQALFTPVSEAWISFELDIDTPPTINTTIMVGWDNDAEGNKIFDLQIVANSRTIRLRNASSVSQWVSGTMAAGVKHRIYVRYLGGATAGARRYEVLIFSGSPFTIPSQESGVIVSNAASATIGKITMGHMISGTAVTRFGRLRGSTEAPFIADSTESVTFGPDITGVEPGTVVTLSVNTTGVGSLSITQTAGPTVVLSGTGTTRTFTAPAYWPSGPSPTAPTLTFQATYGSATDTINVTPYVHARWRKTASFWTPVYSNRKIS